jgi:hypothetical protein
MAGLSVESVVDPQPTLANSYDRLPEGTALSRLSS